MDVSGPQKKKARKYDVSWQYLAMADLMAVGYGGADAYAIVFRENSIWSLQKKERHRDGILNSEKFQILLATRKRELSNMAYDANGNIQLISTDEVAREILRVAQTMPEGSKERGEMFDRYADIIRKNDTQTDDDDNPVRIYLPMKCTMCQFFKKNKQNAK